MSMLRTLARTVPRSARSFARPCSRHAFGKFQWSTSLHQPLRQTSALRASVAAFSSSSRWRQSEGQVNDELAAKLESELAMEKEIRDPNEFPPILREYLDNSAFQIHDTPGKEEVIMTRQFGDENIRISFSIDDLNHAEDDDRFDADALRDEIETDLIHDDEDPTGAPKTKGVNQRRGAAEMPVATEDRLAPSDRPELEGEESGAGTADESAEPSFPAHVHVTVERPGKGALQIEAIAQDGLMIIDNVYYFRDPKLADPRSLEHQVAARDLYTGPPFGNLDEDLQVLLEKYLEERGINTAMALFVPEYIDYKEQKEYLSWLEAVKTFVE